MPASIYQNYHSFAYFSIQITDLGTPKLLSVEVTGSRAKHPKPITRSINFRTATKKEIAEWEKNPGRAWISKEELEEYDRLQPEADSVERWQLKVIEQFRFQLLLQSQQRQDLHQLLDDLLPKLVKLKHSKKVKWSLDVDPQDLY
jgi:primosomal protein N'